MWYSTGASVFGNYTYVGIMDNQPDMRHSRQVEGEHLNILNILLRKVGEIQ